MIYFLAFDFKTKGGELGNGNCEYSLTKPPTYEKIKEIEREIKKTQNLEWVCVSFFQKL